MTLMSFGAVSSRAGAPLRREWTRRTTSSALLFLHVSRCAGGRKTASITGKRCPSPVTSLADSRARCASSCSRADGSSLASWVERRNGPHFGRLGVVAVGPSTIAHLLDRPEETRHHLWEEAGRPARARR